MVVGGGDSGKLCSIFEILRNARVIFPSLKGRKALSQKWQFSWRAATRLNIHARQLAATAAD